MSGGGEEGRRKVEGLTKALRPSYYGQDYNCLKP